jgi:hypothetical protein
MPECEYRARMTEERKPDSAREPCPQRDFGFRSPTVAPQSRHKAADGVNKSERKMIFPFDKSSRVV